MIGTTAAMWWGLGALPGHSWWNVVPIMRAVAPIVRG